MTAADMTEAASERAPSPPTRQEPVTRTFHGDSIVDEYTWLEDTNDPETNAFIEAQNAYTATAIADQEELQEAILGEIQARTKETDLTVPSRRGPWWYYSRTVRGGQYPIFCRRAVRPEESLPPSSADGLALDGEQILLDCNELAAGHDYFVLGAFAARPDGTAIAYSTDCTGNERFTIRVRDLTTGETCADEVTGAFYGVAWSLDGSAFFYVTVNDLWRSYRAWRHMVGTPAAHDVMIFEEQDERFSVTVALCRSERFIVLMSVSKVSSEVRLIDAACPAAAPILVAPRRPEVAYSVEHQFLADGSERLLIMHNRDAVNFELATAAVSDPGEWTVFAPHRDDTRLLGVQAFETHLVLSFRRDGITGLRVIRTDGNDRELSFNEPVYTVLPGPNPDHRSRIFRLTYGSLATPDSIYDYDVVKGTLALLRQRPVLALPGGPDFDSRDYETHQEWASAPDGTAIPIALVCRRGTPRDGSSPFVLFGYGSYEISVDPTFATPRLSLLDRGVGFAIAHVRGGGELGRPWYDGGKLLNKKNSFTDFLACARHLVSSGWTSAEHLAIRGGSAGGLLVGAAVNLDPTAFGAVVAQVPFMDVLTTTLDVTRPLTVSEWEEWGDPLHDPEVFAYIKSYSPYENVTSAHYPPILAVASLNDTRVPVAEAAKWIARLQARADGGPFLLKTHMAAGHRGRSGRYDSWRDEAMITAWIISTVGAPFAEGDHAAAFGGELHGSGQARQGIGCGH